MAINLSRCSEHVGMGGVVPLSEIMAVLFVAVGGSSDNVLIQVVRSLSYFEDDGNRDWV